MKISPIIWSTHVRKTIKKNLISYQPYNNCVLSLTLLSNKSIMEWSCGPLLVLSIEKDGRHVNQEFPGDTVVILRKIWEAFVFFIGFVRINNLRCLCNFYRFPAFQGEHKWSVVVAAQENKDKNDMRWIYATALRQLSQTSNEWWLQRG